MNIVRAAIHQSRLVLSILAVLLIAGAIVYDNMPKEAEPDIDIPIIYTTLTLEGISPEDAERLLIKPVEQQVRTIEGIKEMRSTGFEGGAYVLLEFEPGFNADKALADVRDKVKDARPDLPAEADEPKVHEVNLSLFPILVVTLSGDVPERVLFQTARDLQDRLEALGSVLQAAIAGDREEQVEIVIDPALMESYGIDAQEAVQAVSRSNRLIAAGVKDTGAGRFAIKVPGLFETVRDVLDQPIKVSGDSVVRLRDIAHVARTFKDPVSVARVNGKPALALEVSKRSGENIIRTIEQVKEVVAAERERWPAGIEVTFSQDKSETIRTLLTDLENNMASAIVLVLAVCMASLGLRSGLLVGLAIPASFLAGLIVLATFGLTMNIVVLFSLILASGMLVDSATIVVEYADRKMSEGMPRGEAYAEAASRMAWPVVSSVLTILSVFVPLLFWPGVVGEFMKYLPITLLATLIASLVVALIFVPVLGALVGKPAPLDDEARRSLIASEVGNLDDLRGGTRWYVGVLRRALRHPGKVILAALGLLVGVQILYALFGRGVEFFPDIEPENIIVEIYARGNLAVAEKDRLVREVEERLLDMDEFRTVYARTGTLAGMREQAEDVIGTIQIEFVEWRHRRKVAAIFEDIHARTADIAGIRLSTTKEEAGPPVGKPIQIQLDTRYPELLIPTVARIRAVMDGLGGFAGTEDNRPLPGIDWRLEVDRAQAAKFGLDVTAVGDIVKLVTQGIKLGEYRPDDSNEEIDIVVRYPAAYRTIDQLDQIKLQTSDGLVPIANFTTRHPTPKVGQIDRVDGGRSMLIKTDVVPGVQVDERVRALQAAFRTADLDPRVNIKFKGEDKEQRETAMFLAKAFFIAMALMSLVLLLQFNSFFSLGLVLSAVVMSTIGVFAGLLIVQEPFGIVMSGLGVVALAGIIVSNNIILIDTFDDLRRKGMAPYEAIVRTGAQRLRPVLLTVLTTVLGLLPLVFQLNVDFINREITHDAPSTQWWTQLSLAICAGLTFATVLTLIVTPCALMLRANFQVWRAARRARRQGKPLAGDLPPPAANAAE